MNERERIGVILRELREQQGLSQEKVSELSGVGQGHVARIEQGKYSVGIDTLAKLAKVYGKEIHLI